MHITPPAIWFMYPLKWKATFQPALLEYANQTRRQVAVMYTFISCKLFAYLHWRFGVFTVAGMKWTEEDEGRRWRSVGVGLLRLFFIITGHPAWYQVISEHYGSSSQWTGKFYSIWCDKRLLETTGRKLSKLVYCNSEKKDEGGNEFKWLRSPVEFVFLWW